MKNTLVISAFPACGKSYFFNNYKGLNCLDSDSSLFSWIEVNGKKEINPEFPANYIKHIKENIGKADVIFISSHLVVRQALEDASIDYITVYPEISAKEAWLERMKGRGNTEDFIAFQNSHWDEFVNGIENEPHGKDIIRLKNDEYIKDAVKKLL